MQNDDCQICEVCVHLRPWQDFYGVIDGPEAGTKRCANHGAAVKWLVENVSELVHYLDSSIASNVPLPPFGLFQPSKKEKQRTAMTLVPLGIDLTHFGIGNTGRLFVPKEDWHIIQGVVHTSLQGTRR